MRAFGNASAAGRHRAPGSLRRAALPGLCAVGVAILLATSSPQAAATPERSTVGPVAFVVGTYTVAGDSTVQTAWAWHTSSPSDVTSLGLENAAISGPTGWNQGASSHGCAVFRGAAGTLCVGWQTIPVLAGQYTAHGTGGTWIASASASNVIGAPRITKATAIGGTVTVSWNLVASAHSYIVAVTPASSGTCCDIANQVVSASTKSYVFRNVSLRKDSRYRVGVFALSADITKDIAPDASFEVGEGRATVTDKPVTPTTKGTIKGQVHGSASVGGSTVKILDLRVENLPAKTTVVFHCVSGCAVTEQLVGSGTVHSKALQNAALPIGTVIEVRATKHGYTGFYDKLTMHPTQLGFFTESKMCLAPNSSRPRACGKSH